MQVAEGHSVPPPLADNLPDMLAGDFVTLGDSIAAPAQHKVQQHDVALLFTGGVLDEYGDLRREGNLIGADGFLELIEPQPIKIQAQT